MSTMSLPKGTKYRRYVLANKLGAYKSTWARKHKSRRVLRRVGAKVTPTSIARIDRSLSLAIKCYLVNHGAYFWSYCAKAAVRRCQGDSWKRNDPHRKAYDIKRRRLEREALAREYANGPREDGPVPSGWDLYDYP